MASEKPGYRWFVVVIFFLFMFLHQTDKLLIGSLQVQITEAFQIDDFTWGLINSGALAVATVLYPIWGYLYDRFARSKLLALASFIWGATTWLNAIVRTYTGFLITRASLDRRLILPRYLHSRCCYFGHTQRAGFMDFCSLRNRLDFWPVCSSDSSLHR